MEEETSGVDKTEDGPKETSEARAQAEGQAILVSDDHSEACLFMFVTTAGFCIFPQRATAVDHTRPLPPSLRLPANIHC